MEPATSSLEMCMRHNPHSPLFADSRAERRHQVLKDAAFCERDAYILDLFGCMCVGKQNQQVA